MTDQAENLRRLVQTTASKIPHKARRIAFLSGKGGVGKTSIAVNIALALSRMGHRTILIDCDLGLANADILLGVQPKATLDGLLRKTAELSKTLERLPSGLWLLPGAASILPQHAVNSGRLESILRRLDDIGEFILMDGGAGIDEGVQHIASLSDEVVLVVAPESAAALNAYRLIKVLLTLPNPPSFRIIINRAASDISARRAAIGIMSAADDFLKARTDYLGWIPLDPIVEQSARERRPFVERYPGSLPSRAVVALAHRLLSLPSGPPEAA